MQAGASREGDGVLLQRIRPLQEGTKAFKLSTKLSLLKRYFFVAAEGSAIHWKSRRKRPEDSKVNIPDVVDVVIGHKTPEFSSLKRPDTADCSLSIITRTKNLNLVFSSEEIRNKWYDGIKALVNLNMFSKPFLEASDPDLMFAIQEWHRSKKSSNGTINFNGLCVVFKRINLNIPTKAIQKLFQEVDVNKDNTLQFDEFLYIFDKLRFIDEITSIFVHNCGGSHTVPISYAQFHHFLVHIQQETISLEQVTKKLNQLSCNIETGVTLTAFTTYMMSESNYIFDPSHKVVYQDMTRPISHYFINSSHNTYLTGDQLKSDSSPLMYQLALEQGCRCVELDCWDGQDEPIIYHGHTLTSKITFEEVTRTIKEHAFRKSQYPVILSLENHCNAENQVRMSRILSTIFGDSLVALSLDEMAQLPSPESLKGKILLKGGKLPIIPPKSPLVPMKMEAESNLEALSEDDDDENDEDDDEDEEGVQEPGSLKIRDKNASRPPQKTKVVHQLSIITSLKNTKFKTFFHSFENAQAYEMSSFGEKRAERLCKNSGKHFVMYNRKQLSRIYPGGARVNSSNYMPNLAWSCGCQIVALNFQTPDFPMLVNHGKFLDNGGTGYLLKPEYMNEDQIYDPVDVIPPVRQYYIQILTARRLPKPNRNTKGEVIDPYVLLKVAGHPHDEWTHKTPFIDILIKI